MSFRYVAPAALVLVLVFGTMYVLDRRRGGYRAVRLEREETSRTPPSDRVAHPAPEVS